MTFTDMSTAMGKLIQKYPPKRRITALRKARGWSFATAAAAAGIEHRQIISRIEKGQQQLGEIYREKLALAFGVNPSELDECDTELPAGHHPIRRVNEIAPGIGKPHGLAEPGAEPFQYDPALHPPMPPITPAQSRFRVLNRDLSEKGYVPGQVITVEPRAAWGDLTDADAVLVLINGELQLRQYLAPDLLMTNSSGVPTAIRISGHDVRLIGKIVGNIGW